MSPPILNPRRISKDDEDERIGGQDAWLTIDKTIGKVDEDKVKDYMDDIDTLLVFAGLYSAVLTAFLIESYKNLSADPIQALLQQLVGQTANYRFSGGHLNTTFTISQLQAFEVPTSAIRVNVCWFASLIISISTASYGILVKQWLREYLAIDRTALQERLRIRHFRAQGLQDWKLFEIAATLPMFLQIALMLFFVGLCFFTQSIHQSIGHTSLILVCAWAFFFALSVLAPLVSARCPYKTTFLKAIFRYLRPRIRRCSSLSADTFEKLLIRSRASSLYTRSRSVAKMVSDHLLIPCALALTHILHRVSSLGHNNVRKVEHTEQRTQTSAVQDDETSTPGLPTYGTRYWQVQDNLFHVEYMTLFTNDTLEDPTCAWTEESELRSDESGDLVIFRDVDSIFLDDRILGMMREAFQRRPPSGEDVLKFVVEVLERRSGLSLGNAEGKATTPVQWPWALSLNARTTLVELLGDSIRTQVFKTSVEDWWLESPYSDPYDYWMNRTLSLIFSLCAGDDDLPQSLSSTLEDQLRDEEQAESCCCVLAYQLEKYLNGLTPAVSLNWQARVFALLLPILRTLPIEEAAGIFIGIVERAYGGIYNLIETHYPKHTDKSIAETNPQGGPESWPAGERNRVLSPGIVLLLTDVAAGILHLLVPDGEAPKAEGDHITSFPMNTESLLDFIFKTIPVIQRELPDVNLMNPLPIRGGDVDVLFWRLLTRPRHTHSFLAFWSIRSVALQAQLRMDGFLYNTLRSGWAVLRDQEAVEFLLACAGYFEEMTKAEATPALSSVIQICRLVVSVQTSEHTDVLRAWHGMFRSATTLINQFSLAHVDWCNAQGHGQTCAAVYALLDEIDDLDLRRQLSPSRDLDMPGLNSKDNVLSTEDQAYKTWLREFNVEGDPVPDAFINALLQRAVCDIHTWNRMGRGRRLQEQLDRRAGLAGTTTAVPARAEQTGNQLWLSWNLFACMARPYLLSPSSDIPFSAPPHSPLPPMDSTFSLCDTVESFEVDMASVDVAPADNFPSHNPSLGDATDKGAQSPAIGPVTEELAASSAVSVDLPVASG